MEEEGNFQQSQVNVLHYVAYSVLVVAVGLVAYLYIDANDQIALNEKKDQKTLSFRELPYDIQQEYKTISEYKFLETRLKNAQEQNQRLAEMEIKEKPILEEPTEAVIESEDLTEAPKGAKLVKEFASCYDMGMGSYNISWECKKDIISFIDKHKDAKYFEIISLVDDAEFSLYKNLESNNFIYEKLKINQQVINKMKKLSQAGLAKHRAVEANWVIKAHTNRKAKVYSANYNLISHDGKRGVLIRAYE